MEATLLYTGLYGDYIGFGFRVGAFPMGGEV